MTWQHYEQTYLLKPSNEILNLSCSTINLTNIENSVLHTLIIHTINHRVSSIEHCRTYVTGVQDSYHLQKRDYYFKDDQLENYLSLSSPEEPIISDPHLNPQLLQTLDQLMEEKPEIKDSLRKCLSSI